MFIVKTGLSPVFTICNSGRISSISDVRFAHPTTSLRLWSPAFVPRVARSSITAYPSENNLQKNGFLVMKIKSAIFVIYNLRKL